MRLWNLATRKDTQLGSGKSRSQKTWNTFRSPIHWYFQRDFTNVTRYYIFKIGFHPLTQMAFGVYMFLGCASPGWAASKDSNFVIGCFMFTILIPVNQPIISYYLSSWIAHPLRLKVFSVLFFIEQPIILLKKFFFALSQMISLNSLNSNFLFFLSQFGANQLIIS